MISIVNKKTHIPTANDVYCGRGSPLGNPFDWRGSKLAQYKAKDRDDAIEKYEGWLEKQIEIKNKPVCDELNKIYKKVKVGEEINLVCFCVPLRCHCEVVKEVICDKLRDFI